MGQKCLPIQRQVSSKLSPDPQALCCRECQDCHSYGFCDLPSPKKEKQWSPFAVILYMNDHVQQITGEKKK